MIETGQIHVLEDDWFRLFLKGSCVVLVLAPERNGANAGWRVVDLETGCVSWAFDAAFDARSRIA